ncbi:MAG: hypothetical protein A3H96_21915 [Acidobacteria bacterium RIFCSPLOWO2_02_FULL_67_36]|nr:MAG: hypothetical protein A3H96_21915 [Acidobacteria bacterium RIFCSPLOWO2_02_FULL_67_36]OFW19851.1 MAG: hypothetical protein A3G21_09510 [Acidobacteria bacterium RIFCSPLOWO2_12_FULL_66_21]
MALTFKLGDGSRVKCEAARLEDDPLHVTCEVQRDGGHGPLSFECALGTDGTIRILGEHPRRAWAVAAGDTRWVFVDGEVYELKVEIAGGHRRPHHHGSLSAPMPATVIRLQTRAGDRVKRGDTLVVLEAMKMELPVRSNADGVVSAVHCREGDLVQPGVALIEIAEDEA